MSRPTRVALFLVLLHFLTAMLDPFGSDSFGDQQVSDFFDRVSSPLYGGAERIAQSEILVVRITPEDLENRLGGGAWPPSYESQLAILEGLTRHGPTAIFMDFYYRTAQAPEGRPRVMDLQGERNLQDVFEALSQEARGGRAEDIRGTEEVAVFAEGLRRLRYGEGGEIPILIGPIGQNASTADRVSLADPFEPLRAYAAETTRTPDLSVGISVSVNGAIVYPSHSVYTSAFETSRSSPQAAHVLFKLFCDSRRAQWDRFDACRKPGVLENEGNDIALRWGFGSPADASANRPDWRRILPGCEAGTWGQRVRKALAFASEKAVSGLNDGMNGRDCAYHMSIEVGDLFGGLPDDQLASMIEDKIVLIGADVPYLADNFDTPVYGSLPGVFIHAMALDNLIELGPRADRAPRDILFAMDETDLIIGGIMTLAIGVLLYQRRREIVIEGTQTRPETVRWARYALTIAAVTAISVVVIGGIGNWPIGNVFELVLSISGMAVVLEAFAREEA
ncbi:MAG: CHASE2 domain-containing protein [Litorimonas sp.]